MVRYISNVNAYSDWRAFGQSEIFIVDGLPKCIEVFEVDFATRRLVLVRSLGRRAVFLGQMHSMLVSTRTFPLLASNAVYHLQMLSRLVSKSTTSRMGEGGLSRRTSSSTARV